MLYPSVDKLLEKADSKYSLAVAAAKRARIIRDGDSLLLEHRPASHKVVGQALEEILEEKLLLENN